MNRILKNVLIIGGLTTATTALIFYFRRQYKLLSDACYNITGGVIHNISADTVKLTLFFKVKNNSDLTIHIDNVEFSIFVNNLFITKIYRKEKQTILSNSDIIFQINVEFSPKELLKAGLTNIMPLITDKDKLVINIKGVYNIEAGIVKVKKVPFDEKISLKELMTPSPNTKKC